MKFFIWLLKISFLFLLSLMIPGNEAYSKKIKQSLKVEKQGNKRNSRNTENVSEIEINILDSINTGDVPLNLKVEKVKFAGYEKEVNANSETFLVINDNEEAIIRFKVRIIYKDMQGRMLHSREITEKCMIPAHETRKLDISSWDKQHTYYYYLGNEPKKTATPYKVEFQPLSIWIAHQEEN